MSLGLVGRKVGMTRIFTDDGSSVPVTVLDVSNNRVTQIKTPDVDGYAAVQVTFGKRRASRVIKSAAGHLAKAGVEAGNILKEFRVDAEKLTALKAPQRITQSFKAVPGPNTRRPLRCTSAESIQRGSTTKRPAAMRLTSREKSSKSRALR